MKLSFILALLAVPVGASAFLGPTTTASTVGKASSTSIQIASGLNPPDESPNMFQAMGDIWNREVTSAFESSDDDVVIEPDFTLPWLFIVSGAFIYFQNLDPSCYDAGQIIPTGDPGLWPGLFAFLHVWFGTFLADRAMRLRVVFTKDRLMIKNIYDAKTGNRLEENEMTHRENYVVGGRDGWKYKDITNWEFFPSVHMPVLVYFKETATPKSKWNVGPGAYDKRNNGMVHFFPAFGNSFQIKREFQAHNLPHVKNGLEEK